MKKWITVAVAVACAMGATVLAPKEAKASDAYCSKYTGHIVDQTAISKHSYRGKKKRDPSKLTAAVLHQMGF